MKAIILGGGPCGMALADGLATEGGAEFLLLDRDQQLGGLAKTVSWEEAGGAHDLGPHKIFTVDKELWARVRGLLPESEWLTRPKSSRIFMRGKFLPYPPSPFSLISIYGLIDFARMVADYGRARARALLPASEPRSFAEDLQARVGARLYEALFRPIAEKLWDSPDRLDVELSRGRVQTPSLVELVGRLLKLRKSSEFEALEFDYPRGGIQKLWQAIEKRSAESGEFRLGCEVNGLKVENGVVTEVRYRNLSSGREEVVPVGADDFVFSSLPLGRLVTLLQKAGVVEESLVAAARKTVVLNDLLLVFLKVKEEAVLDDSWIFIPDPAVAFHRVSEQRAFDPDMSPQGSIVCCEIMSNAERPNSKLSDEELIDKAVSGLKSMGFTPQVEAARVVRLPNSYPVFRTGYEKPLAEIFEKLDSLGNFRTVGRQGSFKYIGTLDAMDIGYGAARWFRSEWVWPGEKKRTKKSSKERGGQLSKTWRDERERTRHYPVLD